MTSSTFLRGPVSAVVGEVRTLTDPPSGKRAISLDGARISKVGPAASVRGTTGALDFGDRVIMPAFIDPHAHTEVSSVAAAAMVDCRVPSCETVGDVLDALNDGLATIDPREEHWLRAQANLFFNQKLADRRYPTKSELDSVSRRIPIAIHAGGHTSLLNSAAISASGLDRFSSASSGAMGGAIVETGADGQPTGVVSEIDAMLPIVDRPFDLEEALRNGAQQLYTRFGVSVVGDISGTAEGTQKLASLVAQGAVPQRVHEFLCAPGTYPFGDVWEADNLIEASSERYRVAGVKVFADGGFSAKNAATWVAYRKEHAIRPGSRGRINLSSSRISALVRRAAEADLQLIVHGNGERAQASIMAGVLKADLANALPVRIEHAGNLLTRREATSMWRQAGIVAMPQPAFLYNFGEYFPAYLGQSASRGRFPFRSLSEEGFELSGSSDVYVGAEERQTNPFFGMWCSMKRSTFTGGVVEPDEAIDLDAAVLMHTINAARSLGLEKDYGTIEAGKRADLIVLDRDPWSCDVDELLDVQVDYMFVDGEVVYQRDGAVLPQLS